MTHPPAPTTVVYLGGYGRSGSSVLDRLLASQIGALGAGELCNLFSWAAEGRDCACGVTVGACPLWGPVLDRVTTATGLTLRELAARSDAAERRGGDTKVWRAAWSEVLRALADAGVPVVVDSSKTAGGRERGTLLADLPGTRLALFVHLHRALPAVLGSRSRGNNLALERGEHTGGGIRGLGRALAGWVTANRAARRQGARAERTVAVDYVAFAGDPATTLAGLEETLRELGVAVDPDREVGLHGIAGNRVLRAGWDGAVAVDEAWRAELGTGWRVLGVIVQRATEAAGWVPR